MMSDRLRARESRSAARSRPGCAGRSPATRTCPHLAFASALVGYGVATTFVTWLLPFGVLLVESTQRSPTTTDLVMLGVCAVVLGASTLFWAVVLTSDRVTDVVVRHLRRAWNLGGRRFPAVRDHDPAAALLEIRASLHAVARRPIGLLVRTTAAQACGAVILLVALRGLGVGGELGTLEFARVFFVVTLLSSFVPVPGGVGVVEAGLSGALVAAGVEPTDGTRGGPGVPALDLRRTDRRRSDPVRRVARRGAAPTGGRAALDVTGRCVGAVVASVSSAASMPGTGMPQPGCWGLVRVGDHFALNRTARVPADRIGCGS